MKVLKFGGTSVGSPASMLAVKQIVTQKAAHQPVVVVVSALGGITDALLLTARKALAASPVAWRRDKAPTTPPRASILSATAPDDSWETAFHAMVIRHGEMVQTLQLGQHVAAHIDSLFKELKSIYNGVFLVGDLSPKTEATIVSYGERLSSIIVAALIEGSKWIDAREIIKTEQKNYFMQPSTDAKLTWAMPRPRNGQMKSNGRHGLDSELTSRLIRERLSSLSGVAVVPGFISADRDTGEVTNLGRGGSDYTAALIAAALNADELEIWTDVDGFMTADPRVVKTAYTIGELSYIEAMELCNFGAKVIYPPTIYPVCIKNIPIRVKNTFNPEAQGTIIKQNIHHDNKPIKGISSIGGTALITVTGLSMVGVIGVNRRIFTSLAAGGISVFMVSQASSENSTSIGVSEEDADEAVRLLADEFEKEINTGAMEPMQAERGLATVAVVGENMKHTPGIAGKLFGTLGRSGISVIACAQGASETNISFVVDQRYLRKALNVIHDSFFLSEYKVLNLFVCGVGTVGSMLLEQIRSQYEALKEHARLKLNVVGIASSTKALFNRDGIDLSTWRQQLKTMGKGKNLLNEVLGMNIFNSVFVDCTASKEVAAIYQPLLEGNVSVVAANKIAASSGYEQYEKLKQTAVERGVKFRFETNVGAGLPIIGTINDLRNSGDRILKIEAVLSGTLNFIFNEIGPNVPFSETVRKAKELGYSEPDPRIDLSGTDVVRKLVILTREAGYKVEQHEVEKHLFVPPSHFEGTVEDFWRRLPELDADFERQRRRLEQEGKRWRFVARMELGHTSVALEEVDKGHPFYNLEGSNNVVMLTTERYREYPMLIQGYGAGASVTAAGVFANIMSIA